MFTQKYIAQHVASFRNMRLKISFVHNVCYLHWCAFNWLQSFILNKSFHSTMSFTHKLQKWIPIVVPKLRQFSAGWKLATGQFQSDFHCSVPNVVVILHTTSQGVPSCSIGCSITLFAAPFPMAQAYSDMQCRCRAPVHVPLAGFSTHSRDGVKKRVRA